MEWFWVNIAAPAGAPAFCAAVMWVIELMSGKTAAKREIISAYIDGQLGYVAMGWCAATLYDMDRWETCQKHPVEWHGLSALVISVLFFSGLVAAAGARWPIAKRELQYQADHAANGTPIPGTFVKYLTGWSSVIFSVISLLCMVGIHLQVSQPGGPVCP